MAGFFVPGGGVFHRPSPFPRKWAPLFPICPVKDGFSSAFSLESGGFSAGSFPHPAAEKVEKPPLPDSFTQRTHRRNTIAPAIG